MNDKNIYIDMDGVIADFFKAMEYRYGVEHWKSLNIEYTLKDIKGTSFFGQLPKFDTSDALVEYINTLTKGEWNILSSPLRNDYENSTFWKTHWLDKNNYTPKRAIFTGRKESYATRVAGVPNILVDDKPKNIDKWVDKGGIGIVYQANENGLDYLQNAIKNAFDFQEPVVYTEYIEKDAQLGR